MKDGEAGRVKEKIYGYREDILEELKREKRMEEPRKWGNTWVEIYVQGDAGFSSSGRTLTI